MTGDTLQIRLLGPVDVTVDGAARPVSGLRRKAVLAVLGLHPGEIVGTDRLIDIVWGARPPATAANTLQSHMSYLRGVLGTRAAIVSRPPGYLLDTAGGGTDVARVEQLVRQAAQAPDHAAAVALLRAALDLWRGPSLSDVTDVGWLAEQATRLEDMRLEAVVALVEARLALGEHTRLVPELERLAELHPFREHIQRQLMLALYRTGRQADALAAYQRLRREIGAELGLDPSPALRDLEAAILRQDPALDPPPVASVAVAAPAPPAPTANPAQLPLAVAAFTGRQAELAQLDAALVAAEHGSPSGSPTVTISAVSGTAGVGKTALAVHWAHQVAGRFPDGQLYVNLRGFDPGGSVMDPAEAIRGFLGAFGVPADRIPKAPDSQASLYRSVLASKRVLVVVDNARDEEQVRPLLPGSSGCLVLVTSRNQLTGLIATEGAQPLSLDLPSAPEAREMLTRRLGSSRAAAEPQAVDDIIARCARLPLALAVAAARAATYAELPLATLAAQLHDTAAALDPFHGGDAATDVRAVFSWSYQTLSAEAAQLFRWLGLGPGPDIALPAAASLVGLPWRQVRPLLAELTRVHLLTEPTPGRYGFHDLLRAYAIEQARLHDDADQRSAALHRLLDHYLHTAYAAAMLLSPLRDTFPLGPTRPGVAPEHLTDRAHAMSWFTAEHRVLLAAVTQAPGGFDRHGWQLAWTLVTFLDRRGFWQDNLDAQAAGLAAARRAGDRAGEAQSHRSISRAHTKLGNYAEAEEHNRHALRLFGEVGDPVSQAHIRLNFAWVEEQRGHFAEALTHAELARGEYESAGHRVGQAHAVNTIGWCHAQLGDPELALTHCRVALALFVEVGDRQGAAGTWDSLGYAYVRLGSPRQAAACYRHAADLFRELGDRFEEAFALVSLGDAHDSAGDHDAARQVRSRSVTILDQLHHPAADEIRAKLAVPGETPEP